MSDSYSVHADLVESREVRAVDTIISLLPKLPRFPTVREDTADDLVEIIQEFVRDGRAVVEVRVQALTRSEWDEIDGRHITGWKKRVEYRTPDGTLVAAVDYETDD